MSESPREDNFYRSSADDDEVYSKELILKLEQKWMMYLRALPVKAIIRECISGINRLERMRYRSCAQNNVRIRVGDVCFIDFGQVYVHEAGYQHFGVIMALTNHKAFVVPMTSNSMTFDYAVDQSRIEQGKNHLMQIGYVQGLNKKSVCFINDCRFINTARIIDVKGYIPPEGDLFKSIQQRILQCIFK